ncbi:MAG: ACT domain-containing protein [Oscillospiraceae bacterium]|nr:ACT domain-containing protein [Oscillospiraceae bacterium]
MSIKQISVFVENRPGRLAEITGVLADNGIDIRALSVADTAEYGILRLIVDKPEKTLDIFKQSNITANVKDVLAAAVPDTPGSFAKAVRILTDSGISIEYAYAFITPKKDQAYVIFRVADNDKAGAVLSRAGFSLIEQDDIF